MGLLAYIVIAAAIFGAGVAGGIKWELGVVARRDLAAVQQSAATQIRRMDQADTAAGRHEAGKARIQTRYVAITQETEHVIRQIEYRDRACLDADGLRIVASAIAAGDAAGQPAPALPAPPAP